ncbi:MAG: hypothetical protein AB8G05_05180 [Oligoflexales bacterium]
MQDEFDSKNEDVGKDKELEESKINELETKVVQSNFFRKIIFFIIVLVCVFGLYKFFSPHKEEKLNDPLNVLSYETLAMEEDQSGERLYLPSKEKIEIDQYFGNTPNLKFKPRSLLNTGLKWLPEGASIIDYEVAKIAVVQYSRKAQTAKIFFFTLFGNIDNLANAEEGNEEGLVYQPYATDQLNMVVWQDSQDTLAVLVGRLSIKELAKMARLGTENK